MKRLLLSGVAFVLIAALTLALLEGIYSLAKTKKPHLSVTYQALTLLDLAGGNAGGVDGAYAEYFADPATLSAMIPMMRDSGVGLGNTPFADTMTEEAAVNTADGACTGLKPNLTKTAFFLRTSAFNPFDPPTVFHDVDAQLDPALQDFLDRYGKRRTSLTTNAAGERVTLPSVDSPRKVIVAGDSIAFGAMVSDDETIASQMQYHTQRLAKAAGIAARGQATAFPQVQDSRDEFANYLKVLQDGGFAFGVDVPSAGTTEEIASATCLTAA